MTTKAEKLEVLGKIQQLLNVEDGQLQQLPEALKGFINRALTPPCIVAIAFNPATGEITQAALSNIPQAPEAYNLVSRVLLNLSQQFQNTALEVAKNAHTEESLGQSVEASELRDGRGEG